MRIFTYDALPGRVVFGLGREVLDIYDDWARHCEVEESGCVLVRPDAHVAWRRRIAAGDCAAELSSVMDRILGFEGSSGDGVQVEETARA